MIKHVWTVLCEKISTDHTGGFSYLTSFDGLSSTGVPFYIQMLSLSIKWFNTDATEGVVKFRLELVRPDGKKDVLGSGMEATIKANNSYRANIILDGLPIKEFGTYKLLVIQIEKKKNNIVAEIPFWIEKTAQ